MFIDIFKYKYFQKRNLDYKKILIHSFEAFLSGGTICLFAQILYKLYSLFISNNDTSKSLVIITVILIGSLLTAFGYYDHIGQIAKAGIIIPITGFSNSLTSCAMEYKSEGVLLGLGSNTLKLAGSVIVFGIISGYIVGLFKYLVYLVWK